MTDSIPPDVQRFLREHIQSVEALEVLLLLHADPERVWTAAEVGSESCTNEWSAQMHLEELSRRGIVHAIDGAPIIPAPPPSLEEGLDDTLTVMRLGLPRSLERVLSTTNAIDET